MHIHDISHKVLFNPVKTYLASYLILYLAWICINVFADLTSTSPEGIQNLLDEDSSKREAWVNEPSHLYQGINKSVFDTKLNRMHNGEIDSNEIIRFIKNKGKCTDKVALQIFNDYVRTSATLTTDVKEDLLRSIHVEG
jgi:hypothetical protein